MSSFLTTGIQKAKTLLHIGTASTSADSVGADTAGGAAIKTAAPAGGRTSSGPDTYIWLGMIAALAAAVWFSLKSGGRKASKLKW